MELKSGSRLGPYEILSRIGEGGMGQVWKARDTRLDRIVAIKTSAARFSDRFDREARAVAALNHPHICTLYDIGPDYLVMEYVEGSEIKGPLPLDQTLKYAIQLASALEAAHRKGITHRDLKPANILVTKAGIKVLDFGLAKFDTAKPDPLSDETVTRALTQEGSIVGTLQYMAPEQLQAKAIDARADIFSFGCVLYETLTGKRAFDGTNTASVIAGILEREPPSLEGAAPASLDWALRRCLAKDPDDRWQTARDLRAALERIAVVAIETTNADRKQPPPLLAWGIAAALAIAAGTLSFVHFREKPAPAPDPLQFRIRLPDQVNFTTTGTFVLSPDGRRIAFSATGPNGPGVWIQDMDSSPAHPLPDASTSAQSPPFFWSPDSRYVAFSGGGTKLRKADLEHGGSEDICEKQTPPVGGDWSRDGVIIFGSNSTGLWRVPASGGTPVPLTTLDSSRQEIAHELPSFLPDGIHFVYFVNSRDSNQSGEYVGSLDAPPNQKPKKIVATQFGAVLVRPDQNSSAPARLLYLRNQLLEVQDFDTRSLELQGEPIPFPVRAGTTYQTGYFSAARNLLVYRNPASARLSQFAWRDVETGQAGNAVGEPGLISEERISPDGSRIAYRSDSNNRNDSDIWILDLARGSSTRLTFGQGTFTNPVWSPDGSEIAFAALKDKKFQVFRRRADGSGEAQLMVETSENARPLDWSPDGKFLLYDTSPNASFTVEDIWLLPLEKGAQPFPFANSRFDESAPRFSPDGRWIVYESNETGRYEVYARGFPASPGSTDSAKRMISKDGGRLPQWRSDGKEVGWVQPGANTVVVSAEVDTSQGFRAGLPRVHGQFPSSGAPGTYSADLKRRLVTIPESQNDAQKEPQFFDVMVNWTSALKK